MPRPIDAQRSEETTVSPSNDIVTLERELRDFRRAIRLTQEVQGIFQNIKNIPDHQTSVPWTYARALSYQLPSLPPLDKDDPRVILLYRQYIKYYYDLLKFQCKFEKLLDKAKKYDGTAYRKFRKLLDAGEYGDELQDGESGEEVAQSFIQEMEDRISMLSVEHGADLH
ncbi:hypothetical protein IWQ61_007998 [Dispira simplex]|nr:hypothetical protein IWQ61_007998 [Dispira simplex]